MANRPMETHIQSHIYYPTIEDVKSRITLALLELYRHDFELFDIEVNERSITHKLAEYLQWQFPYWHVDCEYNRREEKKKKLEEERVFPDIIVHRRRTGHNLLVIEVKKGGGSSKEDINKLRRFIKTPEYLYRYGVFLALGAKGCKKAILIRNDYKKTDWTDEIQRPLKELGHGRL